MECKMCGACCTAISISSLIPGLGRGKMAGERCPHLSDRNLCNLFGKDNRPKVCSSYSANVEICGNNAEEATRNIALWEKATAP